MWYKLFKEGLEDVDDYIRSGNVEKVTKRRITMRNIAEDVGQIDWFMSFDFFGCIGHETFCTEICHEINSY